ncbi:repeat in ubiquitin-activating protein-domain-containing protein [Boletus edulis BED1]|uniref:Repeat in ubiquitin-activating protein-domain-containing protein n=1 Tax=Boletus edulis BED1 TaxID=1328754 RepID=A0AAD4BF64_BOLED|nr:repeat in ubiquitin-activating protein-domain-containing protein [Boletus edulis BED1]
MVDMGRSREKPTSLDFDAILDGSFVVKEPTKIAASSSNSKGQVNGHANGDAMKPSSSNGNGGLKDLRALTLRDNLALFVSRMMTTLDFVTAASNLRSAAYYIERKTRWQVKEMAGNTIPAIATTNAIISGLIILQALHLLRKPYTSLKNHMEPAWGHAFLRWTRMSDADLEGDVLAVISLISFSLRTGKPLPQVTLCPLPSCFMERRYGLNIVYEESEEDFGLPKVLAEETLESLQYMNFCVGASTAFSIMTRLDKLMVGE